MYYSNRRHNNNSNYDNYNDNELLSNLFQNKSPEMAIVALILSGKLKFDSVELFRKSSYVVTLVGSFKKVDQDQSQNRVDEIVQYLDQNGDLTVDEIFKALKKKSQD